MSRPVPLRTQLAVAQHQRDMALDKLAEAQRIADQHARQRDEGMAQRDAAVSDAHTQRTMKNDVRQALADALQSIVQQGRNSTPQAAHLSAVASVALRRAGYEPVPAVVAIKAEAEGPSPAPLSCDMDAKCVNPPTMLGNKGYIYCASCGPARRASGYENVRKLRPAELKKLQAGETLGRY